MFPFDLSFSVFGLGSLSVVRCQWPVVRSSFLVSVGVISWIVFGSAVNAILESHEPISNPKFKI
jgi:hypothetical protein